MISELIYEDHCGIIQTKSTYCLNRLRDKRLGLGGAGRKTLSSCCPAAAAADHRVRGDTGAQPGEQHGPRARDNRGQEQQHAG